LNLTPYHSKLFAWELTRRYPFDTMEKLGAVVAGAQVDLNPHQVDAALFAFDSPLSQGALLADEVGLGKTIEAGLVLSQRWAERRRRLLVVVPANLRKQWHQELSEKFFLPCRILESKSYNSDVRAGRLQPFLAEPAVTICSYQFARAKESDIAGIPWDLVVLDEAHRLRNVYKPTNVIGNALKRALATRHKLLLTATPLQNSLAELFGLVSLIDERIFGDLASFREQFQDLSETQVYETLRARLRPICHRTLRRQVSAYVPFTRRHPILEEFTPEEGEDRLYDLVSDYLQRPNLQALPSRQRSLMTLILRKLLASSTFAIAGALETIAKRLRGQLGESAPQPELLEQLDEDFEAADELAEEWPEEENGTPQVGLAEQQAIRKEIADLEEFSRLARSIQHNAKGKALVRALRVAFRRAAELGAEPKAVLFTESRRTQDYLLRVLADSEFAEGIVLFNGSNADDRSKAIYAAWLARHEGTDRVTGSRTADMRAALVEEFRDRGRILIATEAGAEGINLQFCSLVVNYDLPWNPQRIEQRIGRCHRYGQKHDVVVVNFLNRKNEADQRVYELLAVKFRLFEGVFGASDEVLGAIESGVDFERRVAGIYQQCRKQEEIRSAFDQLQLELSFEIDETMKQTRQKLLERFDDEVREKLRVADVSSKQVLGRFEELLMRLTRHELGSHAEPAGDSAFRLVSLPEAVSGVPLGLYELPRRSGEAHTYRLGHPLAEALLERARSRELPPAGIVFDYGAYDGKISLLEPLIGRRGALSISLLTIESLDQTEEFLLLAGLTEDGHILEEEAVERLFSLPGEVVLGDPSAFEPALSSRTAALREAIERRVAERNLQIFAAEELKLEQWAEDLKVGLEREIRDLDRQIMQTKRSSRAAVTLEAKLIQQREVRLLESKRSMKRQSLFQMQDLIEKRRDDLISEIETKLEHNVGESQLFEVRFQVHASHETGQQTGRATRV
jgi:adenine-specific DNA-methyltransferase